MVGALLTGRGRPPRAELLYCGSDFWHGMVAKEGKLNSETGVIVVYLILSVVSTMGDLQ